MALRLASALAPRVALLQRRAVQPPRSVGAAATGWLPAGRRHVAVVAEPTPNPDSVMFYPGEKPVLGEGIKTKKFTNKYDTNDSPLAAAIFKVKGVSQVMLASTHVTVTKTPKVGWHMIQPNVELVIGQFYAAGLKALKDGVAERDLIAARKANYEEGSVEALIIELLEERVRPFVQQDGGDVEFDRFDHDEGVLHLRMHGACAGCPKSNVTLQHGIKNLLEHYIPEVKEVVPVEDEDDGDMPHAHH